MAYSRSKLDKYRVMRHSPTLRSHLPSTRPLNKDNLEAYLDRYRKVIVKPTSTSLGIGVMQVSRLSGNKYEIHYGSRKKPCTASAMFTIISAAKPAAGVIWSSAALPWPKWGEGRLI